MSRFSMVQCVFLQKHKHAAAWFWQRELTYLFHYQTLSDRLTTKISTTGIL